MKTWMWTKRTLAVLTVLAAALLFSFADAEAQGRGHRPPPPPGGGVRGGGFYAPVYGFGYGMGYGYGFGPFGGPYAWGPYLYPPGGGIDLGAALIAGYGAVEFNTKPGQAEVWVDGKFVAEARDLDGYPSYLWLSEGPHKVTVYKGGYLSFEEDIDVRRGVHRELKVRLDKGESTAPGQRPEREKKDEKEKAKGADFSF